MKYYGWSEKHRNYIIIQLAIMDMTKEITYNQASRVWNTSIRNSYAKDIEPDPFRTSYYVSSIHTQWNRLIFLCRSRSHVR